MIVLLLRLGADINAFYGKGRPTALREAVINMEDSKDTEVVDILLEHKAEINYGKDFKNTAFPGFPIKVPLGTIWHMQCSNA